MLGAPFLIVSSSPVAQDISGARQQSPSWPTSFAMRLPPQGSAVPGQSPGRVHAVQGHGGHWLAFP